MITHAELISTLRYEPETGDFIWVNPPLYRTYLIGRVAGARQAAKVRGGAVRIMLSRKIYAAHRLAWFYVHCRWPSELIDHINGDPLDNRIANLREATPLQNQANKRLSKAPKSGFIGVFRNACDRTWKARIRINGKITYLGSFVTPELASEAYLAAHQGFHKDFSGIGLKEKLGSDRANGLPSL